MEGLSVTLGSILGGNPDVFRRNDSTDGNQGRTQGDPSPTRGDFTCSDHRWYEGPRNVAYVLARGGRR
jgi:hypothetical protein